MDTEDGPEPAIGTTGARFGGAPRRRRSARRKAAEAHSDGPRPAPADPPEPDTVAIPVTQPDPTPRSGARQHGAPDPAPLGEPAPAGEPVGLTGARFGGARRRRQEAKPDPADGATRENPAPAPVRPVPPPPPDEEEPVAGGSASVRPYVFTRGRTRSSFELSVETLVSAVPQAGAGGLTGEHHAVLGVCREPRSVAEVAARVGVPLGVARVLVGDLAAAGAVSVHRGAGPDLDLMQRVLSGLRKL